MNRGSMQWLGIQLLFIYTQLGQFFRQPMNYMCEEVQFCLPVPVYIKMFLSMGLKPLNLSPLQKDFSVSVQFNEKASQVIEPP